MVMWDSDIDLDLAIQHDESESMGLKCWRDIRLSDIWIPCHFLPNRTRSASHDLIMGNPLRVLEKRNSPYDGFSVYCSRELENRKATDFCCYCDKNNFPKVKYIEEEVSKSTSSLQKCQENSSRELTSLHSLTLEENILCSKNKSCEEVNHSIRECETKPRKQQDLLITTDEIYPYVKNKFKNSYSDKQSLEELEKTREYPLCADDTYSCIESRCEVKTRSDKDESTDDDDTLNSLKSDENILSSKNKSYEEICSVRENQKRNENLIDFFTDETYPYIEKEFGKMKECLQGVGGNFSSIESKYEEKNSYDNKCSVNDDYVIPDFLNTFQIASKKNIISKPNLSNKRSNRKGKKVQKNTALKMPLGEFLWTNDDSSWCENSGADEFYLHLIQRESQLSDVVQLKNMSEFPSLLLQEDISPDVEGNISSKWSNEISLQKCSKEEDITISNKPFGNLREFYECLDMSENISTEVCSMNEEKCQKEKTVIIIENIPLGVTREDVEAIVLGYGEITDLSLEPHGTCLKAKLKMDLVGDLEWMIECLNGSEPFGVSNSGVLKCYRG